jgi:hypothetical protein
MEPVIIHWYQDWPFWMLVVATITTILSQVPPIRVLIKKAKIELDLYSKIAITHKIGNPNLQLHLMISNSGGRKIRIKNIEATIKRDNKELAKLPAQNYLQNQNDTNTLLFTPFSLKPEEEWSHIVNFLNFFDRKQESEYLQYEKEMLSNFRKKQPHSDKESKELIELDSTVVKPFYDLFKKYFIWHAGEYVITVNICTDRPKANLTKNYRFTIFESQEQQLKIITEHFKYGGGIWWDPKIQTNIILEIKEI